MGFIKSLIIELIHMSEMTKPCYYSALLYCNTVKENLHHKQMDEMSFGV